MQDAYDEFIRCKATISSSKDNSNLSDANYLNFIFNKL